MSLQHVLKKALAASIAMILSQFAGAIGAFAQDSCQIRLDRALTTTPVLNQICPPGIASVEDLFFRPGAAGQKNGDLQILAAILARASEAPQDLSDAEAQRVSGILNDNATIRVGLQVVILSNLFEVKELDDWCRWRRGTEAAGFSTPTGNALDVESALQCYDALQ